MDGKKKCAILIPVWKRFINNGELMSMVQCSKVLGGNHNYEIMLFGPERLDSNYYQKIWDKYCHNESGAESKNQINILKFPDRCFENRVSYSYLLTSKEFYSMFTEKFEYVLIYQLDAWVFSDELGSWCDKGYDFVGAPWCHLCRMGKDGCEKHASTSFVGNGGLSLRKVETFTKNLPYDTFDDALYSDSMPEDIYLGLIDSFKKPKCTEACRFSVETNARNLIGEQMGGALPFGFHGLAVYDIGLYNELTQMTFKGKESIENG